MIKKKSRLKKLTKENEKVKMEVEKLRLTNFKKCYEEHDEVEKNSEAYVLGCFHYLNNQDVLILLG